MTPSGHNRIVFSFSVTVPEGDVKKVCQLVNGSLVGMLLDLPQEIKEHADLHLTLVHPSDEMAEWGATPKVFISEPSKADVETMQG
jgi:hypothetical protein